MRRPNVIEVSKARGGSYIAAWVDMSNMSLHLADEGYGETTTALAEKGDIMTTARHRKQPNVVMKLGPAMSMS